VVVLHGGGSRCDCPVTMSFLQESTIFPVSRPWKFFLFVEAEVQAWCLLPADTIKHFGVDTECIFYVPPWSPDHGKNVVRRPRANEKRTKNERKTNEKRTKQRTKQRMKQYSLLPASRRAVITLLMNCSQRRPRRRYVFYSYVCRHFANTCFIASARSRHKACTSTSANRGGLRVAGC